MSTTTHYSSAGFGPCTKCITKQTGHKTGICQDCRKLHNIKPDKHVVSAKGLRRGKKSRV